MQSWDLAGGPGALCHVAFPPQAGYPPVPLARLRDQMWRALCASRCPAFLPPTTAPSATLVTLSTPAHQASPTSSCARAFSLLPLPPHLLSLGDWLLLILYLTVYRAPPWPSFPTSEGHTGPSRPPRLSCNTWNPARPSPGACTQPGAGTRRPVQI